MQTTSAARGSAPSTIASSRSQSARARAGAAGRPSLRSGPFSTRVPRSGSVQREGRTALSATLQEGIAKFYDESTPLWEDIWGDHLHHGYYPEGKMRSDHRQAQVDMIDEVLKFAGVTGATSAVDVGCGIGGSSRHISKKYGASVQGITLSPLQVERATALTAKAGLSDKVSFQVADALNMPFKDASFDLIWSLESGEHMPDKKKFMSEMFRVAAPGGKIILVTWCHRPLKAGETLAPSEQKLLDDICAAYYLPAWCSVEDYRKIGEELGLQDIRTADWSREVTPFWKAVIDTALTWEGFFGLLRSGLGTIKGALVMPLMQQGLRTNVIQFNLLVGTKPRA